VNATDEIVELLRQRLGLTAAHPSFSLLPRILERRMQAAGCESRQAYLAILKQGGSEIEGLMEEFLVPETYFFRYPESFLALADWARKNRRCLRILSVPCSTGEEPYSIAMCLLDAGYRPEQLHIEGWDISAEAIRHAERGSYQAKAFRGVDPAEREHYFLADGDGWKIRALPREIVHFRRANIFDVPILQQWDVIFCRNVLIYFSGPQQQNVISRLAKALVDDGLIFLGSAEPALFLGRGWTAAEYPMSFACAKVPAPLPERPAPRLLPPFHPPLALADLPSPLARQAPEQEPSLNDAKALADCGRLDEARERLRKLLREEPASCEANFLCGVVEEARGQEAEAESYYRKALYQEPGHPEALRHMALLLERQGRHHAASHLNRRRARHSPAP